MTVNYVIVECKCARAQIAVSDEEGEDCRLFEARKQIMTNMEVCPDCGHMPVVSLAYTEGE